jgi:hypothetical protein
MTICEASQGCHARALSTDYIMGTGKGEPEPPPLNQPAMTDAILQSQLKSARAAVNALEFGIDAWEAAMVVVRSLVNQINAAKPVEEFFSLNSGIHSTLLLNGRVI